MWQEKCCLVLLLFTLVKGWEVTKYQHNGSITNSVSFHTKQESYIGGSDYLLKINRKTGNLTKIDFGPTSTALYNCQRFSSPSCFNCLKVVKQIDNQTLLICGTNAGSPICYHFNPSNPSARTTLSSSASWLADDPSSNFVSTLFVNNSGDVELYVGACPKTECSVARKLSIKDLETIGGSISDVEFIDVQEGKSMNTIYFFFRENSDAFAHDQFTAGATKSSYAMVARICQRDRGGIYNLQSNWMTFMKARLLCPYPGGSKTGSQSSYFDYLRSTYKIGERLYGLFSYPNAWNIERSALCVFTFSEIDSYIDGTAFPSNNTLYYDSTSPPSYSKTYPESTQSLPGRCPSRAGTTSPSTQHENFVQSTNLIKGMVKPVDNRPTYVPNVVFDHVAGVQINGKDVIYLLKDTGLMQKLVLNNGIPTVVSESQVYIPSESKSLIKSFEAVDEGLVVVMNNMVLSMEFANCNSHKSCASCEIDPHCWWQLGCVERPSNETSSGVCSTQPAAPQSLQVTADFPVVFSWVNNQISGARINYYKVVVIRKADNKTVYNETTERNEIEFPNENMLSGYIYKAELISVAGSVQSDIATTEFTLPLSKPIITEIRRSSSECEVTWKAVQNAEKYSISLSTQDSHVTNIIVYARDRSPTLSVSLMDLTLGEVYNVTITAVSRTGVASRPTSSLFSTLTTKTSETKTSAPQSTTTTNAAAIATSVTTTAATTAGDGNNATTLMKTQKTQSSALPSPRAHLDSFTTHGASSPTILGSVDKIGERWAQEYGTEASSYTLFLVLFLLMTFLFVLLLVVLIPNYRVLRRHRQLITEDGNIRIVRARNFYWKEETQEKQKKETDTLLLSTQTQSDKSRPSNNDMFMDSSQKGLQATELKGSNGNSSVTSGGEKSEDVSVTLET